MRPGCFYCEMQDFYLAYVRSIGCHGEVIGPHHCKVVWCNDAQKELCMAWLDKHLSFGTQGVQDTVTTVN